ncbi:TonB-dependent receptor [Novosphingobium sp. 9U]|uniref:TonB-dependent receptor n=1 Tax=Novosphingobium sp. 9U TaxID=2653158 RepID=UPI0012F30BBB|nr:TonB-dependent receptor [Novosphingobium sp. 9U]VWX49766.1 TonB-dependent receptor [Novosphingobium sp. 9U]
MPAVVQAAEAQYGFDIAAGPLSTALVRYAEQAQVQLLYAPQLADGRRSRALRGRFSAREGLERLLAGTGITIQQVSPQVFVLTAAKPLRPTPSMSSVAVPAPSEENEGGEIVVTGTHIHGAAPASPTQIVTRAQIERNGYSSVAQALQALPGNFNGMANEQSALSFADRSGNNLTLASGVNLRGLGPNATLVLVNGRRIAGSGLVGDFADISSIPLSALERVEVVTDGASALYGSDAVAGVVNILLKHDFDGFETRARGGMVTQGHAREWQLSQTAGARWGGGSLLIAYEFQKRVGLRSADRKYARSADLRAFGGTDHRYPYSVPGNVFGFDESGALGPVYAIPSRPAGTVLNANDFLAGQANLENFRIGSDLTPDQRRHSVYARAMQTIADGIELSIEGRFADRRYDSRTSGYATILFITDANPWFVSPTGASSDLIGYAFTRELGATRTAGSAKTLGLTGSLDAQLGSGWRLSSYAGFARQRDMSRTDRIANEYVLAEALGAIPDDPLTAYAPARDGYFNPYGNGSANSAAVLGAIAGYTDARTRSRVLTVDALADGPLFTLPGGMLKLAIGADYRRENFFSRSSDFIFTPQPNIGAPSRYTRDIWAGFAEVNVPLVGAENARAGIEQLELTGAARIERYDDFGHTTNPKFSLRWVPLDGLALRGTWGTSFRAPNLRELGQRETISPSLLPDAVGNSLVVLQRSGGNSTLKPERARSWTLDFDLKPAVFTGLRASVTGFRTIFDRRIDLPALRNFSRALVDPNLSAFVRRVAPGTNAADRALVEALLAQAGGIGGYPLESVTAIVDTRYVNTGSVDVSGLDVDVGYAFQHGRDQFDIGINATYLGRWRERLTPTAAAIDQRNRAEKPVDLRGRATLGWSRGAFDLLVGLNYVDRYRDLLGGRIKAWSTLDTRIGYAPKAGTLAGLTLAVVAQNLLDRSPPFYDSSSAAGYDGANADATGRFVAFEVSKRW